MDRIRRPALMPLLPRLLPPVLLAVCATVTHAQADRDAARRPAEVESIEAYVRGVDLLVDSAVEQGGPFRVFAQFASPRGKTSGWREFADEGAVEEVVKTEQPGTVVLARVFMRAGSVAAVYSSAAAEDGVVWTDHYFRADGTLAKLDTRWRTLGGELQMVRERYFDAGGQLLWSWVEYVDLAAGTPVTKLRPGLAEPKPDIYFRADRLPYHSLVKRPPDATPRGASQ
jgi:hypothetical protein